MSKTWCCLWVLGCIALYSAMWPDRVWLQERPPIQLPEIVIVGQEVRAIQAGKSPLQPQTIPLGLKGDSEAGKVAQVAPPQPGDLAGPTAENPGCLLFPGVQGSRDEGVYRRGISSYNHGNYGEAIARFGRLRAEFPKSTYQGAAAFWSGEAYNHQGNKDAALAQYEQVITLYQREPLRDYALLRAADLRMLRHDYARAAEYLQDLLTMYPASRTLEHALYLSGENAFRLGQFQQASQTLGEFIRRFPQSTLRERAQLWSAESLYQLRQYQEACEVYQAFLTRPGQASLVLEARYGLGWCVLKLGDIGRAREVFQILQQQHPEPRYAEALYYVEFVTPLRQGDRMAAQRALDTWRQRYPQGTLSLAALAELAWTHFTQKDYAGALGLYQQLAESPQASQRSRDIAQYMRGECLYQQADYPAAAGAFRGIRAEAEMDLLEKAAFRLGLSLYHMEKYAEATRGLKAFVEHYATSSYHDEALFWLAEARFQQQEYQAALETYRRLPRDSRLYDYALYGSGWVHLRMQQWPQAITAFQQIVTGFPQSSLRVDALYRLAESYQNLGQHTQAQQGFKQYLAIAHDGPLAPAAHLQLALLTLRSDNFEEAMKALQRVRRQFPGTTQAGEAQYWLGMAFFRRERFAEARQLFQELANTAADHPRAAAALLRVGDAYYNEKRFREGLIAYQKVPLLYPRSPVAADARYGMILSYYQLQQYPQFLRQGQAFIREFAQHPLSVSLLLQIAEYYQEQKRPEDAIQTYTYLLQTYPQSASVDKALLRLGEIYTASGQPQQALVTYERLLRDGRTADLKPDALLGQGRAYEVMGDIPAALQRYTRIAEQFPENVLAARGLFAAGRLLLTQQKYQEAEHYFEQVVTQYSADALRYDSLLQWGIAELQMQRPEHAITLLQQAQQAPEPRVAAQVQLQLGHAYTLLGNLQESSNAYLRLVYLYPDEESLVTQALRQVAKNYVKLGMCSEASTVYNKLLKRTTAAQETQDLQQEMKRSGCS